MTTPVRIGVLAAAVLLLPIQLAGLFATGSEPYPALTQPGFVGAGPLRDDQIRSSRLLIEATFTDGGSETIAPRDLLPGTGGVDESSILGAAFRHADGDGAFAYWLVARFADLFPGRELVSVSAQNAVYSTPLGEHGVFHLDDVGWQVDISISP